MDMIYVIIGFFAVAASMGIFLLRAILTDKPTSKALVLLHGPLAVTGLILLIIFAVSVPSYYLNIAIVFFGIAALMGLTLLIRDMRRKPGPKGLALVHALFALTGIIFVLTFILVL